MRFVYALLFTFAVLSAARPAAASLVVIVSFRDGLVAACDSRAVDSTGERGDIAVKIRPAGDKLLAITGAVIWWGPAPPNSVHPTFDLYDALVPAVADVTLPMLPTLGRQAAAELAIGMPNVTLLQESGGLTRVSILSRTWIATTLLRVNEHSQIVADAPEIQPVGADLPMAFLASGRTEALAAVLGLGDISPSSIALLKRRPPARDVTREMAVDLLRDLIKSAARVSNDIGGAIHFWTLDKSGPSALTERK